MSKNLKHIIENELDWVENVNEHDNFFNWFRTKDGPGKWVGRNIQWWIDHTQNVEYVMSAIHLDISEMLNYANKIDDGNIPVNEILEHTHIISEFVVPHQGKNDIERYILELQSFIKEFKPYFGGKMTLSDMVESVSSALNYGQENNINIHRGDNDVVQLERGLSHGLGEEDYDDEIGDYDEEEGMDIHEDFDWAVKNTNPFLEIGEPLSIQQPKNMYRLHVMHGVGEDYATWVPNWMNYDPTENLDRLIRHIKIVSFLYDGNDISDLVNQWIGGEDWVLSDEDTKNLKEEYDTSDDSNNWRIDAEDIVYEWIREELYDNGLMDHDSYYQDDASVEDWKVTYFDEFGVEHNVKVNLPQS